MQLENQRATANGVVVQGKSVEGWCSYSLYKAGNGVGVLFDSSRSHIAKINWSVW